MSQQFTREELFLLQDFSRNISKRTHIVFYIHAILISFAPLWLYWRIQKMNINSYLLLTVLVTIISIVLITMAYKNTKFTVKHYIAVKRANAVEREVSMELKKEKRMSRKEKDERILWRKNQVADYESTMFSIFYNNSLFLAMVFILNFYVLNGFSVIENYVLTMGLASGAVVLLSKTKYG